LGVLYFCPSFPLLSPNFEDESKKHGSPKQVRVYSSGSDIKKAVLCLILPKVKKHIAAFFYFIHHSRCLLKYLELSVIVPLFGATPEHSNTFFAT
jgi:hypothetical protein